MCLKIMTTNLLKNVLYVLDTITLAVLHLLTSFYKYLSASDFAQLRYIQQLCFNSLSANILRQCQHI